MSNISIWAAAVLTVWWFFLLSNAEKLGCNFSQDGSLTTYNISDSRAPDGKAVDCDFYWINGSDFIIANNLGQIPPVMKSSINSLTTSHCVEGIIYKQHCTLKATGVMIDYTADCTGTCTVKDHSHGEEDGVSKIWIAVGAIVVAIVVAMVLAGLVFLCHKFKDKICRTSSCSQCGGLYMNVKTQNTAVSKV